MRDDKWGFLLFYESQTPQNGSKMVISRIVVLEVSGHSESIGIVDFCSIFLERLVELDVKLESS